MKIAIASGKGGTGKTTIATNLAASITAGATLLDCDVEEPNAHLFLQPDFERCTPVEVFVPAIDPDRCTGCRACVDSCRFNALTAVGRQILVFPELCHSCRGCQVVCPEDAVSEDRRTIGWIESAQRQELQLIQGRMRVGEAMAPPLIQAVQQGVTTAGEVIIDAPPGTSCPVIATIKAADFVVLVTEPTPFGLHDLKLAVAVVKSLEIPSGIVINRSDIGDDAVIDYGAEHNLEILLQIPYDPAIASAYSRGLLLVEQDQRYQLVFEKLLARIEKRLQTAVGSI